MKKSNKFLKKLAVITLSSIAALQNVSADTEINIDQNTITVNFDASNPLQATVALISIENVYGIPPVALKNIITTVTGIKDENCYLYPLDENNFICYNPDLNTHDVLNTAPSTSTQIYDFGNGITFWRGNWTGYCYFIDNGRIILPQVHNYKYQYNKLNGPSYTICFINGVFCFPETNPYAQQININYTPAQPNNNNLNNFNYNRPLVIDSNESQNLFHQTQTTVSPTQAITGNPETHSDKSLSKPPKTPGALNTKGFGKKRVITMPDWTETYTMPDVFLKNPKAVWLLRCQKCAERKKQPCGCVDGSDFTPHRLHIKVGLNQEYRFVCCHCNQNNQRTEKTYRNKKEMLDALEQGQELFYYCQSCQHITNPGELRTNRNNAKKCVDVRCQAPEHEPTNRKNSTQTSSGPTNISPTKKPKPPSSKTPPIKQTLIPPPPSNEQHSVKIGPYLFPATVRQITSLRDFLSIRPSCQHAHKIIAIYPQPNFQHHRVNYKHSCRCTEKSIPYQTLGGILGWKLARAAVLSGYRVPPSQQRTDGWDIYANPAQGSELEISLKNQRLWVEEMRIDDLPANLRYADGSEFTEIDKRVICEVKTNGIPPAWREQYNK